MLARPSVERLGQRPLENLHDTMGIGVVMDW